MYLVMWGNYEKPPWEFGDGRGLLPWIAVLMPIGMTYPAAAAPVCPAWICYPGGMLLG